MADEQEPPTKRRKIDVDHTEADAAWITDRVSAAVQGTAGQRQVAAALKLLLGGATVPFVARYRKEITGGLTDVDLRAIYQHSQRFGDLRLHQHAAEHRLEKKGVLTDALRDTILSTDTKQQVDDVCLPFKDPKKKTKESLAQEAGLLPLMKLVLGGLPSPTGPVEPLGVYYKKFCSTSGCTVPEVEAFSGAHDILVAQLAADPEVVGACRDVLVANGRLQCTVVPGKTEEATHYQRYINHEESYRSIPSHRALAMLRGQDLGLLKLKLSLDDPQHALRAVAKKAGGRLAQNADNHTRSQFLTQAVQATWKERLLKRLRRELIVTLKDQASERATEVFGENLRQLLMAAPAKATVVMGLDPGLRHGCKAAVIDTTGVVVHTATVFPLKNHQRALDELVRMVTQSGVTLIAVGDGTGSRQAEKIIRQVVKSVPGCQWITVSEAGASVYSASEVAQSELPELDVTLRGAVSIARRVQDPLAELVKVPPHHLGVGQFQHDIKAPQLASSLDGVVEDCVNAVGVALNTASGSLLRRVSGLTARRAASIIEYRSEHGVFTTREALLKVSGIGPKTYQQAVGFLRIPNGDNPLDATGIHPEAYTVAHKVLKAVGAKVPCSGLAPALSKLSVETFTDANHGEATIRDVIMELSEVGRDPRPIFKCPVFAVSSLSEVQVDRRLPGVVRNVTDFGAFVDIGVGRDALIPGRGGLGCVSVGQLVVVDVVRIDKEGRITLNLTQEVV